MHLIKVSFAPEVAIDRQSELLSEIARWMAVEKVESVVDRFSSPPAAGKPCLKLELLVRDKHFDTVFDDLEAMPEVVFKLPEWSPMGLSSFRL